ncbi:Uncharacterized protein TCM_019028 [Theobroma cacao]|uniref:Uncharacterized protein n=1 Tax=Theobroma cacao TaxID=3641 RepID=A0A061EHE9_THECC|nr:Uncharacterized protein TCM_019028 [Theobroma cacao]
MLQIRFTVLVFGLLFVMHALNSCSVHGHQGGETIGERLVASEGTVVSAQKEFLGGYFGGRRMGGHEVVRKEIAEKQGSDGGASKNSGANRSDGKCDFEEKGAFNVKCKSWDGSSTPKVETAHFVAFGADYRWPKRENNDAEIKSIGKFEDQANNQVTGINKLEPKTRNFSGSGIPRSDQPLYLPNSMLFEESKAVPPKASLESPSRSDKPVSQKPPVIGNRIESKRLLEAAKEIVNLMHKDYKGCDRPRRKPPINNNVPKH